MLHKLLQRTTPRQRVLAAEIMLWVSMLGFPVSALTFAKNEPISVLGLSWFAITITCVDILCTTDVRKAQDEEK